MNKTRLKMKRKKEKEAGTDRFWKETMGRPSGAIPMKGSLRGG
jgi:hypothetical protein